MAPPEINAIADELRDWLYEQREMTSFDALRVLALVIGDISTDMQRILAKAAGRD